MKKSLLLLVPFFFLLSCKDDETPTPAPVLIPDGEISHQLQGKWINNFVKREYYGDADTIVYADSVNIQAFFEFKGDQMLISTPGNTTQEAWTYAMPDESKPNYITFTQGSRTTDYLILSISDTAMVWEDEEAWAGYPIHVEDKDKKTSKVGKYTWRFSREE